MVYYEEFNHSYLYCMDADLGWGNRSYFTYFSQFNRGAYSSLLGAVESAVLMLLFFLSMLSNMIIFYMLSSDRSLRTVTSYFMCNLTLADVCFTLCCPLIAVVRATERWTLGSVACKTAAYLRWVTCRRDAPFPKEGEKEGGRNMEAERQTGRQRDRDREREGRGRREREGRGGGGGGVID